MSDQLNSGATSETTRTLKTIHTLVINKADMTRMIKMAIMIFGEPWGP